MSDPTARCLSNADVAAYISGQGGTDERDEWQRHIDQCSACSDRVRYKDTVTADAEGLTASDPLPQDDEIPGYKIVREIHRGGQGIVYQAIQASTRRKVAVKVLLEGPFAGPNAKRRFEREISVVGSLRHPNIVPIFDSGVTRGGYYFAMEYVRGAPLAQFVRDSKLTVNDTLKLFHKVCLAVDHAHQKGIIHRDLKPSNILVDSNGEPRVLDFGLARVGAQEVDDPEAQPLSLTGQVMGTLAYMSPEQAAGRPDQVDMRGDVYTLGVILYQLLTDAYPYDVKSQMAEVLKNILEAEPVRPRAKRAEIDDEVETIALKCLSKDKQRRYDTAGALGRDIGRYLAGDAIEAKRDSAIYVLRKALRRYKMVATVGAAFVSLVLVALVVSLGFWRMAVVERDRATGAESGARVAQETAERRARELEEAYKKLNDSYSQLYFEQIQVAVNAYEQGDMVRLRDRLDACPAELRGWEWRHLNLRAILAERESVVLPVAASQAQALAFSPDGKWFALAGTDGKIRVHRAADGSPAFELVGHSERVQDIAFSTDGKLLLSGDAIGFLRLWDLSTKQTTNTMNHEGHVVHVVFSSDGRYAVSSGNGFMRRWNLEAETPIPSPIADHSGVVPSIISPDLKHMVANVGVSAKCICNVTTGVSTYNIQGAFRSSTRAVFSGDSRLVLLNGDDGSVGVLSLAAGELTTLNRHDTSVRSMAISPNGRWAASGDSQGIIKTWDLLRAEETHTFRSHQGPISRLAISPDGSLILSTDEDGEVRLWRTGAQQSHVQQTVGLDDGTPLTLSPDGQWCILSSARVWDLAVGTLRARLPNDGENLRLAAFSPDGKYAATCRNHRRTVFLWNTQDWSLVDRLDPEMHVESIAFVPGSNTLAIAGSSDTLGQVKLWRWEADQSHDISLSARTIRSLALSPKGDRLCVLDDSGGIQVIDIATGRELFALPGATKCVAYSPRGDMIFGGDNEGIQVWDADTSAILHTMRAPNVSCVHVSRDGTRVVTGHGDRTLRMWETSTGKLAFVIRDESAARHLAFAADDLRLVSASGSFSMWDAVSTTGEVPATRRAVIERRLLTVMPEDGWEYPVRLATRYLDYLPFSDDSPERAYSRLASLIREARGRPMVRSISQDRQMDVVEKLVMHPHNWLVVGPFRGGADHEGLDDDLGPESSGAIDPSETFAGADGPVNWQHMRVHAWSKYRDTTDSGRHLVNFMNLFPRSDNVIAYALTYFHCPTQQDVELLLGSDDGIKVWLNDELVHRNPAYRGFRERQDRKRVTLREGRNKLLVKLDQSGDRWGFAMEFLDDSGWPAEMTWATEREMKNITQ